MTKQEADIRDETVKKASVLSFLWWTKMTKIWGEHPTLQLTQGLSFTELVCYYFWIFVKNLFRCSTLFSLVLNNFCIYYYRHCFDWLSFNNWHSFNGFFHSHNKSFSLHSLHCWALWRHCQKAELFSATKVKVSCCGVFLLAVDPNLITWLIEKCPSAFLKLS